MILGGFMDRQELESSLYEIFRELLIRKDKSFRGYAEFFVCFVIEYTRTSNEECKKEFTNEIL